MIKTILFLGKSVKGIINMVDNHIYHHKNIKPVTKPIVMPIKANKNP